MSIANRFRSAIQSLLLIVLLAGMMTGNPILAVAAAPDPVLQWIGIMNSAVITANSSPLVTTRVVALVSASVFDAVNGIHPGYNRCMSGRTHRGMRRRVPQPFRQHT